MTYLQHLKKVIFGVKMSIKVATYKNLLLRNYWSDSFIITDIWSSDMSY